MLKLGGSVWVPVRSKDAFEECTIRVVNDGAVECFDRACQKHTIPASEVLAANPKDLEGVPDNTQLMYLHDAALLHNVRVRYARDQIYTYTAHLLIAVNPYKPLPLYADTVAKQYSAPALATQPPHVYAVAERALRAVRNTRRDQSIIVSGESGAGKTETCKYIMQYIARGESANASSVEQHIVAINPLLEAFGNARTCRNNNSSRFGKYTEILFDSAGKLQGTRVHAYLLETSRVSAIAQDERSFHVFYQLLAGASAELRVKCHLEGGPGSFALLKAGQAAIRGVDDAACYQGLRAAMSALGLSSDTQDAACMVLGALLHLGNVVFVEGENGTQTLPTPSAAIASNLLGLDETQLIQRLQTRTVRVHTDTIHVPLGATEASYARDTLVRHVYGRLFAWLLGEVNHGADNLQGQQFCIGMLDLAGFEVLATNGLEQLCFNSANERLQALCDVCVLDREQQIYELEGLSVERVPRPDCSALLGLLEDPRVGIFALLDEECILPGGSAKAFTRKVLAAHVANPLLTRPRPGQHGRRLVEDQGFLIAHYAAPVVYETASFLERNTSTLPDTLCGLPTTSSFAKALLPPPNGPGPGSTRVPSVTAQFRQQLSALMDRLAATTCHFVRCIRPNQQQQPAIFDAAEVLNQLRCSGMGVALRLLQSGYPTRVAFRDLYDRYAPIMPSVLADLPPPTFAAALLMALGLQDGEDFQIGLTKVFMRSGKMAFLDNLLSEGEVSASVLAAVRRWLYLRRFRNAVHAVRSIGRLALLVQGLRSLARLHRAVRVRLRIHQVFKPLLNRVRAHIHNAAIAKRQAARAQAAQEELARTLRARQEAATQADRAKQRQLQDARFAENVAQAGLVDRVSALGQLHATMTARIQAATQAVWQATTERDRESAARSLAESQLAALQQQTMRDAETIRSLRAQLLETQRSATQRELGLEAELQGVRVQLQARGDELAQAARAAQVAAAEQADLNAKLEVVQTERSQLVAKVESQASHMELLEKSVAASEARAVSALAALEQAQGDMTRERETLTEVGSTAQREMQRVDADLALVRAQLEDARAQVTSLQARLDVATSAARQQAAEAEARLATQEAALAELRAQKEGMLVELGKLEMERGDLVRTAFVCQEAQTKLKSLYRQIRANDLLRLVFGDTSFSGVVRLGASRTGELLVRATDKGRWTTMQCVLNDVFLLAYDKLTDPAPKIVIRMDQARVDAGADRTLSIVGPGRTVLLQAATADDADKWLAYLQAAVTLMA